MVCSIGGLLTVAILFLLGKVHIQAEQSVRIIWVLLIIISSAYRFQKNFIYGWRFHYLFRPTEVALTVHYSKRDAKAKEQFVNTLSTAIKNAEIPTEQIIFLLSRYGLLTRDEHNKLLVIIAEKEIFNSDQKVINIREQLK